MMRLFLTLLFVTPLALGAPTARAATCDRDFLKAQAASYVAAQKAGTPSLLTNSSTRSTITYTQNFKTAILTTGILSTPLRIDHNRSIYDTTQCATYSELISTEPNKQHVIGTQLRFAPGDLDPL